MGVPDPTELVGYAASLLVVVSLAMTSLLRLRVLSLVGSLTFVVYAVLIGSVPVLLTNAAIAAINVWFLWRELAPDRARGVDLGASPIRPDSPFLLDFVRYHHHDIARFQPGFVMPEGDDVFALVLTRDGLPAGFVVGRRSGRELRIDLDHVLAAHRDSRLGRWLYGAGADVFREAGFDRLVAHGTTDVHRRYLTTVGFRPTTADRFELTI